MTPGTPEGTKKRRVCWLLEDAAAAAAANDFDDFDFDFDDEEKEDTDLDVGVAARLASVALAQEAVFAPAAAAAGGDVVVVVCAARHFCSKWSKSSLSSWRK